MNTAWIAAVVLAFILGYIMGFVTGSDWERDDMRYRK